MTIRLLGRTEIRHLAKSIDFRPRKSFGQNFVHDANTVRRIVSASSINRSDHVLEVGPGLGSLTLALLDRGAKVTAVEIDPVLANQLPTTIAAHSHSEVNRLTVLNRDILTFKQSDMTEMPTALVANLPYNVAVPALLHLLAEFPSIRTVRVLVQAEVSRRQGQREMRRWMRSAQARRQAAGSVAARRRGLGSMPGLLARRGGSLRRRA